MPPRTASTLLLRSCRACALAARQPHTVVHRYPGVAVGQRGPRWFSTEKPPIQPEAEAPVEQMTEESNPRVIFTPLGRKMTRYEVRKRWLEERSLSESESGEKEKVLARAPGGEGYRHSRNGLDRSKEQYKKPSGKRHLSDGGYGHLEDTEEVDAEFANEWSLEDVADYTKPISSPVPEAKVDKKRRVRGHEAIPDKPNAGVRSSAHIPSGPKAGRPPIDQSLAAALAAPTSIPYTVGTDICHMPRIRDILREQLAKLGNDVMPPFWRRVLTPIEAQYSGFHRATSLERRTQYIAGRWAAKEAVIKAFGIMYPMRDKVFMHDIVILSLAAQRSVMKDAAETASGDGVEESEANAPGMALRTLVKIPAGERRKWLEASVSISHDGEYATAVALVPFDPRIAGMVVKKSLIRHVNFD